MVILRGLKIHFRGELIETVVESSSIITCGSGYNNVYIHLLSYDKYCFITINAQLFRTVNAHFTIKYQCVMKPQ